MPVFTVVEGGWCLLIVAAFFLIRRIVESDVATAILSWTASPGCLVLKSAREEHKYREGCWKLFIHMWLVAYGLAALLPTTFLYDSREIWRNLRQQPLTPALYWYYLLQLAYYFSELLTHFVAVKRKDFFMMLLHHLVTILLVVISFHYGFFRVGSLLMLYHDLMDPFLELAKLLHVLHRRSAALVSFALLSAVYVYTRLWVVPFWIWRSILFEVPDEAPEFFTIIEFYWSYCVCNVLIGVLMVLNCVWAWFLFAAIARWSRTTQLQDTRSDDEQ